MAYRINSVAKRKACVKRTLRLSPLLTRREKICRLFVSKYSLQIWVGEITQCPKDLQLKYQYILVHVFFCTTALRFLHAHTHTSSVHTWVGMRGLLMTKERCLLPQSSMRYKVPVCQLLLNSTPNINLGLPFRDWDIFDSLINREKLASWGRNCLAGQTRCIESSKIWWLQETQWKHTFTTSQGARTCREPQRSEVCCANGILESWTNIYMQWSCIVRRTIGPASWIVYRKVNFPPLRS